MSEPDPAPLSAAATWVVPFRGRALAMLVAGSAVGALAAGAEEISIPILPDAIRTILTLYVLVVGCLVARDVARGGTTLEHWPGLPTREEFFVPVARVAGAAIWILGPVVAMQLFADPADRRSRLLFWSVLVAGGYVVPMVIARVAVRESFLAGHPIAVIVSLFRTWKSYSIASIPFFLAAVALGVSFSAEPRTGAAVAPLAAYLSLVAFAGLGRFHTLHEARLRVRRGKAEEDAEPPDEPDPNA